MHVELLEAILCGDVVLLEYLVFTCYPLLADISSQSMKVIDLVL